MYVRYVNILYTYIAIICVLNKSNQSTARPPNIPQNRRPPPQGLPLPPHPARARQGPVAAGAAAAPPPPAPAAQAGFVRGEWEGGGGGGPVAPGCCGGIIGAGAGAFGLFIWCLSARVLRVPPLHSTHSPQLILTDTPLQNTSSH